VANPESESSSPSESPNASPPPQEKPRAPSPPDTSVHMWSGEALAAREVLSLPLQSLPQVIVLAGEVESGKTTFLAAIYEMFREGPVGPLVFSGSRTLRGFEARCHDARVMSGRGVPDTAHTPLADPRFLHLQITDIESGHMTDLLLSDVNGERFSRASQSTKECKQLIDVSRADQIVYLFDGAKVAALGERQNALHVGVTFLRRCLECGVLGASSRVDVVMSKWDLVSTDGHAVKYWDQIQSQAGRVLGGRVARITFSQIASRPATESALAFGHGTDELLKSWVAEGPRSVAPEPRERSETTIQGLGMAAFVGDIAIAKERSW
jgi:hypothetical protein